MFNKIQQQPFKQKEKQPLKRIWSDSKISKDTQIDQNKKTISKQNFQGIFDDLIILLKELKTRQDQVQQFVQNEIQEMNTKLDQASKQIFSAISQIQQNVKEVDDTQFTSNISKQNHSNKLYFERMNKEIINNKLLQSGCLLMNSKSAKSETNKKVLHKIQQKEISQSTIMQNNIQVKSNANGGNSIDKITKLIQISKQSNFFQQSNEKNIRPVEPVSNNAINQLNSKNKTNQSYISNLDENRDDSILQTQYHAQLVCQCCMRNLESEFISTPCYHNYHDQCLKQHYQLLLQNYNKTSQLVCLCKIKLPQLFFQKSLQVNLDSLFEIQLSQIKGQLKNQIGICVKCKFFWIKRNSDTQTKQCQMCNQNGIIILKSN